MFQPSTSLSSTTISTELVITVSSFFSLSCLAMYREVELSSSMMWSPSTMLAQTSWAMSRLASTLVLLRMV